MNREAKPTGAPRTQRIVGRATELAAIRDAIEAESGLRVLYIIGEGGTGKTRLLEEVPRIIAQGQRSAFHRHVGPLDFYASSLQTVAGLGLALAKALDPTSEGFQRYRRTLRDFADKRQAGVGPPQTERLRQEMEKAFVEGFNEISRQARVIITLDTLEVIQYESDEIQEICGLEQTGLEVKDWLLSVTPRLENAAVVMAGREKRELAADLKRHFGDRLTVLRLGPFSEAETLEYFAAVAEAEPALGKIGIPPDQLCVVHHYTGGHPLRLGIVIDLLGRDLPLPQALFDSLEDARRKSAAELEAIREQVEEALATGIMTADRQIDVALPYMALARKGVNPELLKRLTGWKPETCADVLDDLRNFSFVKIRPGGNWLFLHDEMYDLMEKHVWSRMEAEREYVCWTILAYYEEMIERTEDPSRRQDLMAEQLYYQLLTDPREGYAQYVRLSNAALFRYDVDFDMRLRDEVLRFCSRYPDRVKRYGLTPEFIDYDSAVRWAKRYRYTGRYDRVIDVAEKAKERLPLYQRGMSDPKLARADLDIYHALALIYTGKYTETINEAVKMLKAVIAELEGTSSPEVLAHKETPDLFDAWRRNLVLGQAHNNLGYAYRARLWHYYAALNEFDAALPHFLAARIEEEIANTLDNMGRVHALLGEKTRAELLVRDGLELRRRLGREFRIALSLNSQAIVHLDFGEVHYARHLSGQALQISERLETPRGIGLACITLGRSLRHLGALWREGICSFRECHEFLADATENLQRANDIFPEIVEDPVREIEACNELGCAHRERAALLRSEGDEPLQATREEEEAVQWLKRAVDKAEGKYPVLYVDSCEDLAQVCFQQEDLDSAEAWLNRAAGTIPSGYKVEGDAGPRDVPKEPYVEEFWRQMGKIEMLRGHAAYHRGLWGEGGVTREALGQAMHHYALAAAYFGRYSDWAGEMQSASARLYDNFRRCRRDDLEYLRDQVLKSAAETHCLDYSRLVASFEDTLGLALQVVGGG